MPLGWKRPGVIVVYLDRAVETRRGTARRGGSHRLGSHLGRGELRLRERDDIGVSDCVWSIAGEGIMLAGYSQGHRRVERLKLEGWPRVAGSGVKTGRASGLTGRARRTPRGRVVHVSNLDSVGSIRRKNGRARAEGRPRRRPLAGRYFRGNQLGNSPCEGTAGSWVTACGGGRGRNFGQYERLASDPWETIGGCSRIGVGRAVARDAPTSSAALRCPRVV